MNLLTAQNHSVEPHHTARNSEEEERHEVPARPFRDGLRLDAQALGPAQGVDLREQIELHTFPLQLLHALGEKLRVLLLPIQQLLEVGFRLGFVADRPYEAEGAEEGAEGGDPGAGAEVGGGGGEEEEEGGGVEEEEDAVEVGDLLAGGVDLGFLEREAVEDELLLLQPLLQEEFVGRSSGDLVERVHGLRFH